MISSVDVANLFLSWANRDGDLITNLKMQKLLYYAQAWHLVYFKKPLFCDSIKAWSFGPIATDAYYAFKKFGYSPIQHKETGSEKEKFNKNQLEFLDECYGTFIKYPAYELVNITHNEDPWKNAYKEGSSNEISHESMKVFYSKLLEKNKK